MAELAYASPQRHVQGQPLQELSKRQENDGGRAYLASSIPLCLEFCLLFFVIGPLSSSDIRYSVLRLSARAAIWLVNSEGHPTQLANHCQRGCSLQCQPAADSMCCSKSAYELEFSCMLDQQQI